MKSSICFLAVALAVLNLTACDVTVSGGAEPSNPQPPTTQRPRPPASGGETSRPPGSVGEQLERDSFALTLASGRKRWNLRNVVVTYLKTDGRGGTAIESWTATCSGTRPMTMTGAYPNVTLNLAAIDCGAGRKPRELDNIAFIGADMSYEARHIPAYPSEPNQFRLGLRGINSFGVFNWSRVSSLNALVKDRVAFFDFVGEERGTLDRRNEQNHFMQVSIERDANTQRDRLRITYTLDGFLRNQSADLKVEAELAPIQ